MEHAHVDKFAKDKGLFQSLDPRTKIIFSLITIILIVANGNIYFQPAILISIVTLAVLSNIPLKYLFRKSLYFLPFTVFILVFALSKGLGPAVILLAKSWLSFLTTVLLVSSTEFQGLLKGIEKLKMPKLIILLLSFMYRYLFLLTNEFQKMIRAASIRNPHKRKSFIAYASIIGTLFVRTYERAERVYQAMISRGFDGDIITINKLAFSEKDVGFMLVYTGLFFLSWAVSALCITTL